MKKKKTEQKYQHLPVITTKISCCGNLNKCSEMQQKATKTMRFEKQLMNTQNIDTIKCKDVFSMIDLPDDGSQYDFLTRNCYCELFAFDGVILQSIH